MLLARTVALTAATLTTGLVAGLFYAFSCAVMPGLRRTDDATFITAMRAIMLVITGRVNVPLNERLEAGLDTDTDRNAAARTSRGPGTAGTWPARSPAPSRWPA